MCYAIEYAGPGYWILRRYERDRFGPKPGEVVSEHRSRASALAAQRRTERAAQR